MNQKHEKPERIEGSHSDRFGNYSSRIAVIGTILAAAFIWLAAALPATGQAPAAITGRAADRRGDAVRGASVEVRRVSGASISSRTETGDDGRFVLANLAPGEYEVRVSARGFATFVKRFSVPGPGEMVIDAPLEPEGIAEAMTVTPARAEVRLADAPASVSVLDSSDIDTAGAQTVDDLLRQVPGFSIFRRSSSVVANPTTQGVSLRGAGASGSSRTLVLADGIPLNDAFGGWVYWDRVPRSSIDRIELVRGGSSDLYGSDALSGVINLLTRQPAAGIVDAEGSYGNRDTSDATFFAARKWKGYGASISGEAFKTGGYLIVPAQLRGSADEEAASKHRALSIRLSRDIGAGGQVFLKGSLFDEDRKNGTRLQRNDTATETLATGLRFNTRDGSSWNLAIFANRQRFHQSFTSVAANRNSETITRLQFVPSRDAGLSLNWSRLSFARHLLVAGFDIRGVRGTSDEVVYAAGRPSTFVSAGGRQRRAGFFVQDLFSISGRWQLAASARYDNWRDSSAASVERNLSTGVVRPAFFAARTSDAFNPRLTLTYRPGDRFNLRFSGYRAFRAPTLNELYRAFRVGDTLTQANDKLVAERLSGGEAGATWSPNSRVMTRLTGFWTETVNPITNFTISVTPALITRQRRNLGRVRSRGIEAEADFNFARFWSLSTGYLFADATVLEAPQDATLAGLWIPQVPRHQFTLQASYANPKYATAGIQFRATGRQFDDDRNLFALGSFAVIDASASRRINRFLEIFIAAQNLLDERIVVGRTPIETLGMPRMVRGGLRLNLGGR